MSPSGARVKCNPSHFHHASDDLREISRSRVCGARGLCGATTDLGRRTWQVRVAESVTIGMPAGRVATPSRDTPTDCPGIVPVAVLVPWSNSTVVSADEIRYTSEIFTPITDVPMRLYRSV